MHGNINTDNDNMFADVDVHLPVAAVCSVDGVANVASAASVDNH
jgi:hypothetical protein